MENPFHACLLLQNALTRWRKKLKLGTVMVTQKAAADS